MYWYDILIYYHTTVLLFVFIFCVLYLGSLKIAIILDVSIPKKVF